jgi:hypothetical protein
LTEHHRCPRGLLSRLGDALVTTAVGGLAGWLLCLSIEERPSPALILAAAALGAVLASAIRQAASGPSR